MVLASGGDAKKSSMLKLAMVSSSIGVAMTEQDKKNTNPPFSKGDVALIHEAVVRGGPIECPQCGSPLTIDSVMDEIRGASSWIHCTNCSRNLVVHNL